MVVQVLDCDRHKYAAELNLLYMALWLCFNSIVFKHCLFHIVLNWTLNVLVGGFFFIIISFPEYGKREAHMSYLMSITVTMKYIQISIVCQELPVHMYMSVMWQHGIPVWSQLMVNTGRMFLSSTFFQLHLNISVYPVQSFQQRKFSLMLCPFFWQYSFFLRSIFPSIWIVQCLLRFLKANSDRELNDAFTSSAYNGCIYHTTCFPDGFFS